MQKNTTFFVANKASDSFFFQLAEHFGPQIYTSNAISLNMSLYLKKIFTNIKNIIINQSRSFLPIYTILNIGPH